MSVREARLCMAEAHGGREFPPLYYKLIRTLYVKILTCDVKKKFSKIGLRAHSYYQKYMFLLNYQCIKRE